MKPIIYGWGPSPPVRAVLLTSHALNLDFEFKVVNTLKGENKTPEYLKINPQHTIPTLDDNGNLIWDSHAIVTYLVGKYGKNDSLYPKDLHKRAIVDQRLHFDSGVVFPKVRSIVIHIRSGKGPIPDDLKESVNEIFEFLEAFLGKNSYMAGNSLTVADLCLIATLTSLIALGVPVNPEKFPKLTEWINKMSQLPYFNEANVKGLEEAKEMFASMAKTN